MPKNVKSKDKERNQIEPRASTHHMLYSYDRGGYIDNAGNQMQGSEMAFINRTNTNTTGLDNAYTLGNKQGVIIGVRKWDNKTKEGYQLYLGESGELASRKVDTSGNGTWNKVPTSSEVRTYAQQQAHQKVEEQLNARQVLTQAVANGIYFKIPEQNPLPGNNLDNMKTSGIFKVSENATGCPPGIPANKTWGVLLSFKEGGGVVQLYVAVDGTERGKVFTRTYLGSSWAEWRSFDQSHDHLFSHPQPLPSNTVSKTTPTGYYITDQSTQGLPNGISGVDKKGFLKVLKDNDHGILTFTSSTNNKVYTGFYNATSRAGNELNWTRVASSEGHVKVHDTRDQNPQLKPIDYHNHTNDQGGGYIVYEWKWAKYLGDLPNLFPGHEDKHILLTTFIPESKNIQSEALISQLAYSIVDHKYFWRKSNTDNGQSWGKWEKVSDGYDFRIPERDSIKNPDAVLYSGVYKTKQDFTIQGRLPDTDNKDGFLTHYKFDSNQMSGDGTAFQYWQSVAGRTEGNVYTRYKLNTGRDWSNWVQLGTGGSSPTFTESMADAKYTIKPEVNSTKYVSDFNNINGLAQWGSGTYYFKNTGLSNKPSGMSDGWGTMTVNFQSIGSKTGNMFVCPSTGASKGKIYYRSFENGNGTPWKEITATGGGSGITEDRVRAIIKEELINLFTQQHT